jgi:hypothetical protein
MSTSKWFVPGPQATPTVEEQFAMDAEVGSTAAVTSRKIVHTPVRISKEAHIGYLADMDQQWRHDRISALRNRRAR